MNLFETNKEKKLYQKVATSIAKQLQNREFMPGDRLPSERTLAEELSVSRATIREAIITLEILGFVEIRTGAGIFVVSTPDPNSFDIDNATHHEITPYEFLEMRLLIEPEFAEMAALQATPEEIEGFKQLQAHTEKISDLQDYYYFDKKFHQLLASATHNTLASIMMQKVWQTSEKSLMPTNFNKHFVTKRSWEISITEHKAIIDAIIDRDPKLAKHAMYSHLAGVLLRLKSEF